MPQSRAVLEAMVERSALRPPMSFDSFADVHVPLSVLTSVDVEKKLVDAGDSTGARCVAVLGGRGEGKSSVIAAATSTLRTRSFFCPRIRAIKGDDLSREAFVLHMGREIIQALPRVPQGTTKRLASTLARGTGGHQLGSHGLQIRSAAQHVTTEQGAAERYEAMMELANVAQSTGHPMVLVVEDTDPYMPAPGPELSEADASKRTGTFIGGPLEWLAREAPCPAYVAVHSGHEQMLHSSVEKVSLPPFLDASAAVGQIAVRYAKQGGLAVLSPEDFIEDRALAFLAGLLVNRPLRDVLRLLPDAAERAVKEDSETAVIRYVDVESVA